MDVSVPYHAGFLLGRAVDMRKLKPKFMLTGTNMNPTSHEMNLTTLKFSFVTNLKDLCDVLSLPPEYLLKVKLGQIENEAISACISKLGRKNTTTIIFRGQFMHKKQVLPYNTVPLRSSSDGLVEGEEVTDDSDQAKAQDSGSLDETAPQSVDRETETSSSELGSVGAEDTHWVKAWAIGNEMIIIFRLSCADNETYLELSLKMAKSLGAYRGALVPATMEKLKKLAEKMDKKLSKKDYSEVKTDIEYCVYQQLDSYPASLTGMVGVLETFADHCVGWTESCSHNGSSYKLENSTMTWHLGDFIEKKKGVMSQVGDFLSQFRSKSPEIPQVTNQAIQEGSYQSSTGVGFHVEADDDSFVELALCGNGSFYPICVTLQSFEGDETGADLNQSLTSLAMSQYPEETNTLYDRLYTLLDSCMMAMDMLQRFLISKAFLFSPECEAEGKTVLRSLNDTMLVVSDSVRQLDMILVPNSQGLEDLFHSRPLETVEMFIQRVTTKLPPGNNLDLLLIGKTGHGKSATGCSILGKPGFFTSSSNSVSTTDSNSVGWAEVDGRILKVVDTPGICDTNLESEEANRDLAIHSMSEAITSCNGKLDALLLVIRYGTKMTTEERGAVEMLKKVLGKDVIRDHGVCVITYGDNFEVDMQEKKKTFEEWYKSESDHLGNLFKECSYRCVLFNNKAKDPMVKKSQLIQLVAKVDSLQKKGKPYTSELFQFALEELKKIQAEMGVPEATEDMMREMGLVLDYLNIMVRNTDQPEGYQQELTHLTVKVDALKNRVSTVEPGQLSNLVETVFSLAENIHKKLENIADRTKPDSPDRESSCPEGARPPPDGAKNELENQGIETGPMSLEDQLMLEDHRDKLQDCMDKDVKPQLDQAKKEATKRTEEKVREKGSCFPGCAQACLENGSYVAMQDLQVGQKVLVRDSKGKLKFSSVYMFGHHDADTCTEFVILETCAGEARLSPEHLIPCMRDGSEVWVSAENVNLRDYIFNVDPASDTLKANRVVGKRVERLRGLFAPFTYEGTVVVDGTLMSCYVACGLSQEKAHSFLTPVRQLSRLSPRALAWVNGWGLREAGSKPTIPWWPKIALKALETTGVLDYSSSVH